MNMYKGEIIDMMVHDGLWEIFNGYHMGITAENINDQYGITREEQDEFGFRSQERAAAAIASGRFKDEIVPVVIKTKKGDVVFDTDEHPRKTTQEKMAGLKPAFKKEAAKPLVMLPHKRRCCCYDRNVQRKPMNCIKPVPVSATPSGVDPSVMGLGPIPASRKALEKAG